MAHYRAHLILAACAALAACSGGSEDTDSLGDTGSSGPITGDTVPLLPTVDGDPATGTFRAGTNGHAGSFPYKRKGDALDVAQSAVFPAAHYDPTTDTFTVDNLPFDGDGVYARDDVLASLNGFQVYENTNATEQRSYKAFHKDSAKGQVSVSLVTSGAYVDYGYGGFIVARNGVVNVPVSGSATFTGDYAGMRVFEGRVDHQYTTGNVILEIDFEDFNGPDVPIDAVEGVITNRQVFDTNGNAIVLKDATGATYTLPTLTLATGDLWQTGEIAGEISSQIIAGSDFEAGEYYAVLGGANADEIAGIIVIESTDPLDNATVQETGGFIASK